NTGLKAKSTSTKPLLNVSRRTDACFARREANGKKRRSPLSYLITASQAKAGPSMNEVRASLCRRFFDDQNPLRPKQFTLAPIITRGLGRDCGGAAGVFSLG